MPCHAAMTKRYLSLSPDEPVEEALARMKQEKVESAPVVDEDGKLAGLFSIQVLMKNLLPVSVAVSGGVQLDVAVRAAPGIAKRLRKVGPLKVADLMDRKPVSVNPETPTWEGVNTLVTNGAPLFVVERETGVLTGVITFQSAFDELERLKDSES